MSRLLPLLLLLTLFSAACGSLPTGGGGTAGSAGAPKGGAASTLRILSGSENATLVPMVQAWGRQKGWNIEFTEKGSVDQMLLLESGQLDFDAVWPANSMWVALGDRQKLVSESRSIMRSPVIFGVKQSVAQQLGWIGREVRVRDILSAAEAGKLRFAMTSATQSNSGASAYFGFLYAFAGEPDVLTSENLQAPQVRDQVSRILGQVNRSSGSSGWLKTLFLDRYDDLDAMVNYEALIIETNQELVKRGREPLYAVYPVDGITYADSPLGFVNKGDDRKRQLFDELQQYLLSEPAQKQILATGRRTAVLGGVTESADNSVFNPTWGIQVKDFTPIKLPRAEVIREALDLYQTAFRKASFTVYALDFSGSMRGAREQQLKSAMRSILDQEQARKNLLQGHPNDVTAVIVFDSGIINEPDLLQNWTVRGNDPAKLKELADRIQSQSIRGGTNIYQPIVRANQLIRDIGIGDRFPAIILMSDGESERGTKIDLVKEGLTDIPAFTIRFGDAGEGEMVGIGQQTHADSFDGRQDLTGAFRKAKGYN